MKRILFSLLFLTSLASLPAFADSQPTQTQNESQLVEHRSYINSDGNQVHSPAHTVRGLPPAGATAKCSDGTFSFSQHHQGTCSHHGGVTQWLDR